MGHTNRQQTSRWGWISGLGIALFSIAVSPTAAAERVTAKYLVEVSVPIAELEAYATEGRLGPTLELYTPFLKPELLEQFRSTLRQRLIDIEPDILARLLDTPVGTTLLERLSQVLRSERRGASAPALRQGMLAAAATPEGLTTLNLMRHFPDEGLHVDVETGVKLMQAVEALAGQTEAAIATIRQRSQRQSPANPAPALTWPQQPGSFTWEQLSWTPTDRSPKRLQLTGQARSVPMDVYFPTSGAVTPRPVIVISHGFASDRQIYAYLAKHLASHGYVVAVPEHVGSSAQAVSTKTPAPPIEFVDRPLDITFVLDQLATTPDRRLQGRMNLNQVGVLGHSYGGYTALAAAGASLSPATLRQDCDQQQQTLNVALLLQCDLLAVPTIPKTLVDPRVKAVMAISPIGRSVFGPTGFRSLKPPVMIVSAGDDMFAPSLLEQIEPFTWLSAADQYLVMIEKGSHFSTIDVVSGANEVFVIPPPLLGPTPEVSREYVKGLGLVFFHTHLQGASVTQPLPPIAHLQSLSRASLPLRVLQQLSAADLPSPQQSAAKP